MKNDLRQQLHLEPQSGWLNDPNGLCFFKGRYHVYFQYAPGSADGSGKKCWGHFQSRDMISWEFTGTVLFPDSPDDADGVFSGSAVVRGDTLYLFYTGNVEQQGDFDLITAGRGANTILVTTKDGVTMSEKKVVLRNSDYPGYCSCHVRDPKVWEQDGTVWCLAQGRLTTRAACCFTAHATLNAGSLKSRCAQLILAICGNVQMITSVGELERIRQICEKVRNDLSGEGISFCENVEIGIMIETPAAAIISDRLAPMVDFFSVGTNDLTQYTLACDRQNPALEQFADTHHEAILRLIEMSAKNAHASGAWIGICGELAADLSLTETFLRMGIDELSVSAPFVLPLREKIRSLDLSK